MINVAIATQYGFFFAVFGDTGLCRIDFPGKVRVFKPMKHPTGLHKRWLATTAAALNSSLFGQVPRKLPPIDLAVGTEFQKSVWSELRNIPLGQTRSYGEIARRLNKPGASRAVGSACGANPVPVVVPCHRVLAAHRRIGGFSAGSGWKQCLLRIEGAQFVE